MLGSSWADHGGGGGCRLGDDMTCARVDVRIGVISDALKGLRGPPLRASTSRSLRERY